MKTEVQRQSVGLEEGRKQQQKQRTETETGRRLGALAMAPVGGLRCAISGRGLRWADRRSTAGREGGRDERPMSTTATQKMPVSTNTTAHRLARSLAAKTAFALCLPCTLARWSLPASAASGREPRLAFKPPCFIQSDRRPARIRYTTGLLSLRRALDLSQLTSVCSALPLVLLQTFSHSPNSLLLQRRDSFPIGLNLPGNPSSQQVNRQSAWIFSLPDSEIYHSHLPSQSSSLSPPVYALALYLYIPLVMP